MQIVTPIIIICDLPSVLIGRLMVIKKQMHFHQMIRLIDRNVKDCCLFFISCCLSIDVLPVV